MRSVDAAPCSGIMRACLLYDRRPPLLASHAGQEHTHEEVAPAHPPQRDAQLLDVDGPAGHPDFSFGAGGWNGPFPSHTKCLA